MLRRANKLEHMLDGTTGNAASFPGVNSAKWHWRSNEKCYDFCVERDDGRKINWIIHSTPGKNLYDLDCPTGEFIDRMKSQDIKRELNDQLKDWFGERVSRRSRMANYGKAWSKWKEFKTVLGTRKAAQEILSHLRDYMARDAFETVAHDQDIDTFVDDYSQPSDLLDVFAQHIPLPELSDRIARSLPSEELHNAVDEAAQHWDVRLTRPPRRAFRDLLPHKIIQTFQEELESAGFTLRNSKNISGGKKGVFETPSGSKIEIDAIKGGGASYADVHTNSGTESYELNNPRDVEEAADTVARAFT